MQGWRALTVVSMSIASILVGANAGCLKLSEDGPSQSGSGGSQGTGGSTGSGGRRADSDVPTCAALFDDACEQPSYVYYLALCENENSSTVVYILDCVVPDCRTPVDQDTASCIQLAVQDKQSEDVASLMYDLEALCGSQLDSAQVRVVGIHAASIDHHDRLVALTACLSNSSCSEIVDCLTDPEVAPWWED